jgi:hypothetical protein
LDIVVVVFVLLPISCKRGGAGARLPFGGGDRSGTSASGGFQSPGVHVQAAGKGGDEEEEGEEIAEAGKGSDREHAAVGWERPTGVPKIQRIMLQRT